METQRVSFIKNHLDYGGSEGIYLTLSADIVREGDRHETLLLGTAKTLDASDEAMRYMAVLLADFIVEAYNFIGDNREDFTFSGYKVRLVLPDGKSAPFSAWYRKQEDAIAARDKALKTGKYGKVVMMDLENRTEAEYTAQEV